MANLAGPFLQGFLQFVAGAGDDALGRAQGFDAGLEQGMAGDGGDFGGGDFGGGEFDGGGMDFGGGGFDFGGF